MNPTYYIPALLTAFLFIVFIRPDVIGADPTTSLPFSNGETIKYDIMKLKLKMGDATLVFNGPAEVDNQKALLITFTATGFKFYDREQIYVDPETFFPLVIRRDLDIFGKEEKITEYYDTRRGKVRIVKTVNGETREQTIENGKRFDNIYGFIYRYRRSAQFDENEEFHLHLPGRDVRFRMIEKKKILLADQEFDAYYISTSPKKYKVWFDSGPKKIPLKIKGALGAGNATMVIRKHYDEG